MSVKNTPETPDDDRVGTGVSGLDQVLQGGLPTGRIFLVHGNAGTGKTTLGLHFLMAGAAAGMRCLCLTLLQTQSEINDVAASHGWSLDGVKIMELPAEVREAATVGQTVFAPSEVELGEVMDALEEAIERYQPELLFVDSLSELGVLVDTGYQLRRQLIRLKERLDRLPCTTLLSAGPAGGSDLTALETMVHGVIGLEMVVSPFGRPRRQVVVTKMRGMDFIGGYHDARIVRGGLVVHPRILAPGFVVGRAARQIRSGNDELDAMLGGGLETGTTCVMMGTSGAGKSTLAALYAHSAASSGHRSALFCFDERPETLLRRMSGLGMPLDAYVDDETIRITQVNVGDLSVGRLGHMIRRAVEDDDVRIVVLDSLSGFLQAMPGEHELITQLHELLSYLSAAGVLTIMVVATHGLFGDAESRVDVSYIADSVLLLRHFEARGEVRRCIAVMKKRYGDHERTIRELGFGSTGVRIGDPLRSFSGVLSGLPRYEGDVDRLIEDESPS